MLLMLFREFLYECPQQVKHLVFNGSVYDSRIIVERIHEFLEFTDFRHLDAGFASPV